MRAKQAIRSVTQFPSWLYQRYSQLWVRAFFAAGWALLYVLCDASLDAFPVQWRVVLAACIFLGGLYRPVIAYAFFIAAIAYPLYLISVYLMALALAVLILSAPWTVRHLPIVLMIFAPLVAPFYLTSALPLLAGLLEMRIGAWASGTFPLDWSPGQAEYGDCAAPVRPLAPQRDARVRGAESAIAGGLVALWLKICAALSGYSPDLWRINGWTMTVSPIYARFHDANSLQSLARLFGPLVVGDIRGGSPSPHLVGGWGIGASGVGESDGTFLLFNLLQVFAWAAAAYAVAVLRDKLSLRRNVPLCRASSTARGGKGWAAALSLCPGILLIWAGYVVVPSWLSRTPSGAETFHLRWFDPHWLPAQVLLSAVVAWGIDGLLRYLRQPVMPPRGRNTPYQRETDVFSLEGKRDRRSAPVRRKVPPALRTTGGPALGVPATLCDLWRHRDRTREIPAPVPGIPGEGAPWPDRQDRQARAARGGRSAKRASTAAWPLRLLHRAAHRVEDHPVRCDGDTEIAQGLPRPMAAAPSPSCEDPRGNRGCKETRPGAERSRLPSELREDLHLGCKRKRHGEDIIMIELD